jgi:hypothetical protein
MSNLSIAKHLHISNLTAGKRRRRFAEHGLKPACKPVRTLQGQEE